MISSSTNNHYTHTSTIYMRFIVIFAFVGSDLRRAMSPVTVQQSSTVNLSIIIRSQQKSFRRMTIFSKFRLLQKLGRCTRSRTDLFTEVRTSLFVSVPNISILHPFKQFCQQREALGKKMVIIRRISPSPDEQVQSFRRWVFNKFLTFTIYIND